MNIYLYINYTVFKFFNFPSSAGIEPSNSFSFKSLFKINKNNIK